MNEMEFLNQKLEVLKKNVYIASENLKKEEINLENYIKRSGMFIEMIREFTDNIDYIEYIRSTGEYDGTERCCYTIKLKKTSTKLGVTLCKGGFVRSYIIITLNGLKVLKTVELHWLYVFIEELYLNESLDGVVYK